MKWHSDVPQGPTELIHPVKDQRYYLNYHPFNYPKTTYLQEGSQGEDTQVEEDSQEEEFLEEAEDIQEEEAHLEQDPLVEDGGPHQSKYHNHNQGNW